MTAALKTPTLLVKIYEINTFNYRETGRPLNLAINLDGLVAPCRGVSSMPNRRAASRRPLSSPRSKKRGVYVVELMATAEHRALAEGTADVLQEVTAAGHAFTVLTRPESA